MSCAVHAVSWGCVGYPAADLRTATRAFPIGCMAGLTPKRPGAVIRTSGAWWLVVQPVVLTHIRGFFMMLIAHNARFCLLLGPTLISGRKIKCWVTMPGAPWMCPTQLQRWQHLFLEWSQTRLVLQQFPASWLRLGSFGDSVTTELTVADIALRKGCAATTLSSLKCPSDLHFSKMVSEMKLRDIPRRCCVHPPWRVRNLHGSHPLGQGACLLRPSQGWSLLTSQASLIVHHLEGYDMPPWCCFLWKSWCLWTLPAHAMKSTMFLTSKACHSHPTDGGSWRPGTTVFVSWQRQSEVAKPVLSDIVRWIVGLGWPCANLVHN